MNYELLLLVSLMSPFLFTTLFLIHIHFSSKKEKKALCIKRIKERYPKIPFLDEYAPEYVLMEYVSRNRSKTKNFLCRAMENMYEMPKNVFEHAFSCLIIEKKIEIRKSEVFFIASYL